MSFGTTRTRIITAVAAASISIPIAGGFAIASAGNSSSLNGPRVANPAPQRSVETAASDRTAVVNSDGTLDRGKGVVSSLKLATGQYEVIFTRNVRQCAYNATIGLAA